MGARDSVCLVGPPGSGKGLHVVVPAIVDWPGPVITTSTRNDNLAVTYAARAASASNVAVFDPERLAPGVPSGPRWPLDRGCDVPAMAMARAATLVGNTAGSEDKDGYWRARTVMAVQCLLAASALGGKTAVDVFRWAVDPCRAVEAAVILRGDRRAQPGWAEALEAILGTDDKLRDSVWSGVTNTFSMLADPRVLEAVTPGQYGTLDPFEFLRARSTLYLLGTNAGPSRLVAALVEDLVIAARLEAAGSPSARLDPPAAFILDEASNFPIPSLPSLVSEGGGNGLVTMVVLQSLAQARSRWGGDAAAALWDASTVKIVLGGQANSHDLADLSRVIGDKQVPRVARSGGGWGVPGNRTVTTETKPILSPPELRSLPFGTGLLLLRSAPPIVLNLSAWPSRADGRRLEEGKHRIETMLRDGASERREQCAS